MFPLLYYWGSTEHVCVWWGVGMGRGGTRLELPTLCVPAGKLDEMSISSFSGKVYKTMIRILGFAME